MARGPDSLLDWTLAAVCPSRQGSWLREWLREHYWMLSSLGPGVKLTGRCLVPLMNCELR
jgi:hypothetical protein